MTIYLSLFGQRTFKVASALEALVARDVRRALGMFADILVSPHIPTSQITGAVLSGGVNRIQEYRIIRSLMRQRYNVYNGRSSYIRNVLDADVMCERPSNLLYADILDYLIRNRKARIDFTQEGYASLGTLAKKMGVAGYSEEDVFRSVQQLVEWGLIEPENLIPAQLDIDDAVRMHATGFIHMRFFVQRVEYLVGVTPNMRFTSRGIAEEIGQIWAGEARLGNLSFQANKRILELLGNILSGNMREDVIGMHFTRMLVWGAGRWSERLNLRRKDFRVVEAEAADGREARKKGVFPANAPGDSRMPLYSAAAGGESFWRVMKR